VSFILCVRLCEFSCDGFEISIDDKYAVELADALLKQPNVTLAGLGARDCLRLEAGLCLYGSDIDDTTSVAEAGLSWTVPVSRRTLRPSFLGASHILPRLASRNPDDRRRVGIITEAPARHGAVVQTPEKDRKLGEVTSGGFSPHLKQAISMAYVPLSHSKVGTAVSVNVRGKDYKGVVAALPFVPTTYKRQPKPEPAGAASKQS